MSINPFTFKRFGGNFKLAGRKALSTVENFHFENTSTTNYNDWLARLVVKEDQ